MENAVPIVPQAPAAQPLQIQSGVLTQVKKDKITTGIPELTVFPITVQESLTYLLVLGVNAGRCSAHSKRFKCRSLLRQWFLVLFFLECLKTVLCHRPPWSEEFGLTAGISEYFLAVKKKRLPFYNLTAVCSVHFCLHFKNKAAHFRRNLFCQS